MNLLSHCLLRQSSLITADTHYILCLDHSLDGPSNVTSTGAGLFRELEIILLVIVNFFSCAEIIGMFWINGGTPIFTMEP